MKKTIVLLLLTLTLNQIQAQKMEISAGYGTPSVFGTITNVFNTLFTDDSSSSDGVLSLELNLYSESMKWRYGLETSYEHLDFRHTGNSFLLSLSPQVDYFWSGAHRKLRFYSGVSAGVAFYEEKTKAAGIGKKDNGSTFTFNVTPVGLRYGGDFGVFLEPANVGSRGIVQGGVSYIF